MSRRTFYARDIDLGFALELERAGTFDLMLIHSQGGGVFDAFAAYAMMSRMEPRPAVHVDGLAHGAALLLLAGGAARSMAPRAYLGFRESWMATSGGTKELRRHARILTEIDTQLAKVLSDSFGVSAGLIKTWMEEERWLGADQALAAGIVSRVTEAP